MSQPSDFKVYKHTTPSGKVYIGITSQPLVKRWKNGKGYEGCTAFFRAVKKYGWNNIQHEVIASGLSKEAACAMEQRLIKETGSNRADRGYNLTGGGEHYEPNDEWKEKLSRSLRAYYKAHPEARQKIASEQLGRKASAETKTRMSAARSAYIDAHPEAREQCRANFKGKKRTAENVEKLRRANEKPVRCNETGAAFRSINEAAAHLKVGRTAICNQIAGRSRTCGGFTFSFIEEGETDGE